MQEGYLSGMTYTVELHQNPLVLDYLTSRYFNGFQLKALPDRIVLSSSDSTIIALLAAAKIIKSEDEEIELDIVPLIAKRAAIKKATRDTHSTWDSEAMDLSEALNSIHAFSDPVVKERLADGFAMYNDLPVLFPRNLEVICDHPAGAIGGVVDSCTEVQTMMGRYFAISLWIMIPTSKNIKLAKIQHSVSHFEAKIAIGKLGIRAITTTEKAQLTERGRVFNQFIQQPSMANYTGILVVPSWFRDRSYGADGRVMVDAANFAQIEPDIYEDMMRSFVSEDGNRDVMTASRSVVDEENLWRCYNRVQGFSMRLKRWGWLAVEGLSPVVWRDDAFDQLVLDPQRKCSVLHLVKHYDNSFSDFIDGKSGGLIFLLHGPAGSGKTLSAEAVAETLRRPLYSISVGELGTTPENMEEKLRSILDLTHQWNAVLLLDEADIFMEARDTSNIQRNAMVSIFLRQLEYYSGVMFLTTNRVATFDPAFFSRVSLAICYPKLDTSDREKVWYNVLKGAGVDVSQLDLSALAQHEVNGRNIKNIVRVAQTMAAGDNRSLQHIDLINSLSLTMSFNPNG